MHRNRIRVDQRKIRRAASVLRPDEREALRLSAGLGLPNDDIAVRLGLSHDEAVRLLARALGRFGRALERQERPWWRFW